MIHCFRSLYTFVHNSFVKSVLRGNFYRTKLDGGLPEIVINKVHGVHVYITLILYESLN